MMSQHFHHIKTPFTKILTLSYRVTEKISIILNVARDCLFLYIERQSSNSGAKQSFLNSFKNLERGLELES